MEKFSIRQFFRDWHNFRLFKKDIKNELSNPNSILNEFDIQVGKLGDVIASQVNCTQEDYINANYNLDEMIGLKIAPLVKNLSSTLNWGDYLVPQISNFVGDDGKPTLSFMVVFIFRGYSWNWTRMIIFYSLLLLAVLCPVLIFSLI